MMYAVNGEESDFLRFRVVDNAVGVAVVCAVSLLLWNTSRDDWWRSAGRAALALAAAVVDPVAGRHRDTLVTRSLQLRTETVEAAAMPANGAAFAAAWTFVAARRTSSGPSCSRRTAPRRRRPAARSPPGSRRSPPTAWTASPGAPGSPAASSAPPPGTAAPRESPPPPETRAELDVARMATAVDLLQRAAPGGTGPAGGQR